MPFQVVDLQGELNISKGLQPEAPTIRAPINTQLSNNMIIRGIQYLVHCLKKVFGGTDHLLKVRVHNGNDGYKTKYYIIHWNEFNILKASIERTWQSHHNISVANDDYDYHIIDLFSHAVEYDESSALLGARRSAPIPIPEEGRERIREAIRIKSQMDQKIAGILRNIQRNDYLHINERLLLEVLRSIDFTNEMQATVFLENARGYLTELDQMHMRVNVLTLEIAHLDHRAPLERRIRECEADIVSLADHATETRRKIDTANAELSQAAHALTELQNYIDKKRRDLTRAQEALKDIPFSEKIPFRNSERVIALKQEIEATTIVIRRSEDMLGEVFEDWQRKTQTAELKQRDLLPQIQAYDANRERRIEQLGIRQAELRSLNLEVSQKQEEVNLEINAMLGQFTTSLQALTSSLGLSPSDSSSIEEDADWVGVTVRDPEPHTI